MPVIIDLRLLDALSSEARASARLRRNRNFHAHDTAVCHRLLNALEPGTYIRPHRHLDANKDESLVMLRGRIGVLLFDSAGDVIASAMLEPGGTAVAIDIPHGTWHSLVALAPGSVLFEAKAGPYVPTAGDEWASFAPPEGDPAAAGFRSAMERRFAR